MPSTNPSPYPDLPFFPVQHNSIQHQLIHLKSLDAPHSGAWNPVLSIEYHLHKQKEVFSANLARQKTKKPESQRFKWSQRLQLQTFCNPGSFSLQVPLGRRQAGLESLMPLSFYANAGFVIWLSTTIVVKSPVRWKFTDLLYHSISFISVIF